MQELLALLEKARMPSTTAIVDCNNVFPSCYFSQITFGADDARELLALLEEGRGAAMAVGAARAPAADITSAVVRPSRCAAFSPLPVRKSQGPVWSFSLAFAAVAVGTARAPTADLHLRRRPPLPVGTNQDSSLRRCVRLSPQGAFPTSSSRRPCAQI